MCVMRSCIQGRARVCLAPVMLAAGILAFAAPALAATITTLDSTRDTSIYISTVSQAADYQNENQGGKDTVGVGNGLHYWYNGKALIGFDVTSLPVENVLSVTLRLYQTDYSTDGSGANNPEVYAVSTANKAWVEGSGNASYEVGAATWNNRVHDTVPWAGSAGLNTVGTDYASTMLSTAATSTATIGTYVDFDFAGTNAQLTSLIDGWRTDNGGLLLSAPLVGNIEVAVFGSKENATAAYRPQLIVTQGPVIPEPSSFVLLAAGLIGLLAYAWRKRK